MFKDFSLERAFILLLLIIIELAGCKSAVPDAESPPSSLIDAISSFEVESGFRIDLVAAEPLISDPVAIEIDEYGRLYVVEMPGYPLDTTGTGRVKLLTDTDGDGQLDQSTIFADNLILPTGVMRWKNGVLVTDAPNLLYLEDTDNDGRADKREVILTGFGLSNPQHNFNTPLYGLDNWIYLANETTIRTRAFPQFSDPGSEIRFPGRPAPTLGQNGFDRNVRVRPDTYELESLSGNAQFGHTFDPWGHHFVVDNWRPQRHEVIAARYLMRNPDLPVHRSMHYTPAYGYGGEVYPITDNPEHQLLTDRGVFTSAAGITYYQGELFPASYANVSFIAEPVHNLIHADRVTPAGATFSADRLIENREFLASSDAWFRPVNLYNGPDGALYVVDYYRPIIEHPEWMDDETIASGRLQDGTRFGRIYRIVPESAPAMTWPNNLSIGAASTSDLVQAFESPNIWQRRTAQRLLMDRKPEAAGEFLSLLAAQSSIAVGRLHSLWALEGLGQLTSEQIKVALQDPEAGIRENAIILAELHLDADPTLASSLLALEHDPNGRVRFQLLCTLGNLSSSAVQAARQRLLFEDMEDEWTQLAALSAPPEQGRPAFEATLAQLADRETKGRRAYLRQISLLIGANGSLGEIKQVIQKTTSKTASTWWRVASLEGLGEGLRLKQRTGDGLEAEQTRLLQTFFDQVDSSVRKVYLDLLQQMGLPDSPALQQTMGQAALLMSDVNGNSAERADAIRLITLAGPAPYQAALEQVIVPEEPAMVQEAAFEALSEIPGPEVGRFVLDQWNSLTPGLRNAAVGVFMKEEARALLLLDAIEAGIVLPATIGWQRRVALMRNWQGEVRDQARVLLSVKPEARVAVVEQYQTVLAQAGDANQGRIVFAQVCSTCHQISGTDGAVFGPDLATIRHWPPKALLAKILNPGRSLADGYELWTITRKNGEILSGIIAGETPSAITVHLPGGTEQILPRGDIVSLQSTGESAMPAGLEQQIDPQRMADLLAFLKQSF